MTNKRVIQSAALLGLIITGIYLLTGLCLGLLGVL